MPNRLEVRDLQVLAYAVGITHWSYKPGDHTLSDMVDPVYWAGLTATPGAERDVISVGDWVFVSGERWAATLYIAEAGSLGARVLVLNSVHAGEQSRRSPPGISHDGS